MMRTANPGRGVGVSGLHQCVISGPDGPVQKLVLIMAILTVAFILVAVFMDRLFK